jgi:hypothetical protein
MKRFKFLRSQIGVQPIPDDFATWMWDHDGVVNPNINYVMHTELFNGILEFLSYFPEHSIIVVHSIVGVETGISHTAETDGSGWGFDIREDQLEITWYQFEEMDEVDEQ